MTDTNPVRIALWGPTSAGKTMLIVQLYNQQAKYAGNAWRILPTESSADFIDGCRSEVLFENKFLTATSRGTFRECTYRFRNERTGREALLSIDDRAGADLVELTPAVREHLKSAHGLVLLFDPEQVRRDNEKPILKMLERIQLDAATTQGKYPHPIAVCLSKTDTLIETAGDVDSVRRDPEDFVRRHIGTEIIFHLQRLCDKYRFFPVSSVDVHTRWGFVRKPVFFDERMTPRLRRSRSAPHPVDLVLSPMAAFSWLFAELGAS